MQQIHVDQLDFCMWTLINPGCIKISETFINKNVKSQRISKWD